MYLRFIEFKHSFFSAHAGYLLNTTLPCVGFSVVGLDCAKIRLSSILKVFIYCCLNDIDFTCTFWQTSIQSQSVKILQRSDKHIITFEAIEKYRYGLRKTVSKHLKCHMQAWVPPLSSSTLKLKKLLKPARKLLAFTFLTPKIYYFGVCNGYRARIAYDYTYSEIRCIALCVLHILGFSVPSIILADLLGNICYLHDFKRSWFVIRDWWIWIRFLFRVSRFVAL